MDAQMVDTAVRHSFENNFGVMLGSTVEVESRGTEKKSDLDTFACASIGMGSLQYECALNLMFTEPTAKHLVELMLGDPDPGPDMLRDGLGEIGNLIAGGLKSSFLESDLELTLGLPAVITGSSIHLTFHGDAVVHSFSLVINGEFPAECAYMVRERNVSGTPNLSTVKEA